jgi:hypothetical protein
MYARRIGWGVKLDGHLEASLKREIHELEDIIAKRWP